MTTHRTLFLTAILCATSLSALGQVSQYSDPETGLLYETDASGVTTVSCPTTNITTISGTVTIPAYVPGSSVTTVDEIKMQGFKGGNGITKVIIEGEGVKICNYAFSECSNIESVEVTGSISSIGQSAFYQASGLKSINLPEGLTEIGQFAFYECTSLASLTTPSTLKTIGNEAFRRCTQLASLNLAEGLERIESSAFREDILIAKLALPSTTKYVGPYAFYANSSIKEITVPKSVSEIAEWSFYNCTALEKISFEGGGDLTTIPSHAFAGCESLEEITIGDGVTTIDDYAFSTCKKLKTLTLPSTTQILGKDIFSGCTSLATVKLYASTAPEFVTDCFLDLPSTAKLLVPNPEAYSSFKEYFGGGIEKLYSFEEEPVAGTDKPEITAADGQSFLDIFSALADPDGDYANANVDVKNDISFEAKSLNLNDLSASNIFTELDRLPTVGSYTGTLNGSTISNLAVRSSGLFGALGNEAQVNGLVFDNATIYVDPTDAAFETEGDDVTIHLLAKKSSGRVTNFGFSGNIIVDSELAKDKEISVCPVNEASEDSEINGFIRIGDILGTGDSKRCITIKQNLGVKRPASKKIKMATSKSLSTDNKSLSTNYTYSDEELMKPVRQFSDEEFAQGAVAYWLNYAGPGYTGEYTAYWSQGKTVPVPAQVIGGVSNALYAVDYGDTDLRHITSAPQFANNGSQITIGYDTKPAKVTIGGQAFTGFGEKGMSMTFDHSKPISIVFASATSTATVKQSQAVKATVRDREVTVSGADGAEKTLINLVGVPVARTNGRSITAPSKGIYLVKVGDNVIKIAVK